MMTLLRTALMLLGPLALWGCVLVPGKFVSSLTVNADRTFAFTYKGEVIAPPPTEVNAARFESDADSASKEAGSAKRSETEMVDNEAIKQKSEAEADAKNREIAAALSKEAGYRSVVYQGKGKFLIDYAIAGRLDHSFVFPFNVDASAIVPFLVVEVRQGGNVRLRAPGFANSSSESASMNPMSSGAGDASKYLDGQFTLDTDAEIVSQNNEDGAKTAGKRKTIAWRATPLTKDAPTAVLRLKP